MDRALKISYFKDIYHNTVSTLYAIYMTSYVNYIHFYILYVSLIYISQLNVVSDKTMITVTILKGTGFSYYNNFYDILTCTTD